ncbi:MAG: alpha/beta hydrolase [Clostridiales bacterium]|nr:alpha/beta hydrolase [Clostridiales bacterium]
MSQIESFELEISTLKRMRKVWVYLPDKYSESGSGLPVIYMHDGQNLFYDELTAYGKAWHVDKCLDDIYAKTGNSCIVVGVECGQRRMTEYSPWKMSPFPKHDKRHIPKDDANRGGEGAEYSEWFATTLKAYIDGHYNTDKSRTATAVAGSSMGGLISCYLGLNYQTVYETMGLFSSYTDFNRAKFNSFVRNTPQAEAQHAFVYCGGKEWNDAPRDRRMLSQSLRLYDILVNRNVICELVLDSEQPHYETAWEIYFYTFAQEFLSRYYSAKTNG